MVVKRKSTIRRRRAHGLGVPGFGTVASFIRLVRRGRRLRMTKRALVTGSPHRVADVAASLEVAGFEVLRAEGLEALQRLDGELELGPGSLDAYVQLPVDIRADAERSPARSRRSWSTGSFFGTGAPKPCCPCSPATPR